MRIDDRSPPSCGMELSVGGRANTRLARYRPDDEATLKNIRTGIRLLCNTYASKRESQQRIGGQKLSPTNIMPWGVPEAPLPPILIFRTLLSCIIYGHGCHPQMQTAQSAHGRWRCALHDTTTKETQETHLHSQLGCNLPKVWSSLPAGGTRSSSARGERTSLSESFPGIQY